MQFGTVESLRAFMRRELEAYYADRRRILARPHLDDESQKALGAIVEEIQLVHRSLKLSDQEIMASRLGEFIAQPIVAELPNLKRPARKSAKKTVK